MAQVQSNVHKKPATFWVTEFGMITNQKKENASCIFLLHQLLLLTTDEQNIVQAMYDSAHLWCVKTAVTHNSWVCNQI